MKTQRRGYIARKFYTHEQGAQSIYEESIFESYDLAYQFIVEISEEEYDRFFCEIVSLIMGDKESYENEERWTFDKKGQLIQHFDAIQRKKECTVIDRDGHTSFHYEPQPKSYTGKFKIGEIVSVKAYPWNQESPMPEDTIGVICQTPIPYSVWIEDGKDKYEWDNTYVIDFIREGYLTHMHISEKNINSKSIVLPENLKFLTILSDHLKGKKLIKNTTLEQICACNLFVEYVHHFNGLE